MHSIINSKIWKKCIKRFSKKRFKRGDSTCSTSSYVEKFVSGLEPNSTGCSPEQLSLYSTDSLEEKGLFFKKYGSKRSCDQLLTKKSRSLESVIGNSIKSDISEDSLNGRYFSYGHLWKEMKVYTTNINVSNESFKARTNHSNEVLLSKCKARNRSHTIGQSYQLEKLFSTSGKYFFKNEQLDNCKKIATISGKYDTLSIDSLENPSVANLFFLKNQFISEDSLNGEKDKYFNKFSNSYRKKSISDGLLHETQDSQYVLPHSDFVILNKILSSKVNRQCRIWNRLLKSNHDQLSLTSIIDLQSIENKESEEEELSEDSLYIPHSKLAKSISYEVKDASLKQNKSISTNTTSSKNKAMNYESDDEKLSLDSLGPPNEWELLENKSYKLSLNYEHFKNSCIENIYCDPEKEDSISIDSLCDSLN